MRWGLGPVFAYEWLMMTRRWQGYALRAAFVGVILLGMTLMWNQSKPAATFAALQAQPGSLAWQARVGQQLFEVIAGVELTLILIVAPATAGGAFCVDKERGSLLQVMATDLTNAEIVLGKLAVRLAPMIGLVFCALPVLALAGLLGGIDPQASWGLFLVSLGVGILASTVALVISIWGRKTHEVLLATYLILILWLMLPYLTWQVGLDSAIEVLFPGTLGFHSTRLVYHPYELVYAPYTHPGTIQPLDFVWFLLGCLLISASLSLLAITRIRGVTLRQASESVATVGKLGWIDRQLSRWPRGPINPSLDDDPVLWREWHRNRPSRWMRRVWGVYSLIAIVATVASFVDILVTRPNGMNGVIPELTVAYQLTLGLLFVGVIAATSLSEERVRGSLDVLLTTPLSSREILRGKWAGAYRLNFPLMVLPAMIGLALVMESGQWHRWILFLALLLAYGALLTSIGTALAVWIDRPNRAVALSATIYIMGSLAIMFLAIWMNSEVTAMGTPFYGAIFGIVGMRTERAMPMRADRFLSSAMLLWIVVYASLGFGLFQVTLANFNRRLGRVDSRDE